MSKFNYITRLFRFCLILVLAQPCFADQIFRYEDKDGNIYFTDTPPDVAEFKPYKLRPLFVMRHSPETIHAKFYRLASKGLISPMIQSLAQKHEMDPLLVEAVVKAESDYDSMAISRSGAQGLMQIMPQTGITLGLQNPFDPQENLDVGIRHLKDLLSKYENNLEMALAAYNAGELSVKKYNGIPPYPETLDYIEKIKKYYSQFSVQSTNSKNLSDAPKPVPYL